jgi:hypothetical protein
MSGLLDGLGAVDKIRQGQRAQQQLDMQKQSQQESKTRADQAQQQQERDNAYGDIQRLMLMQKVARPIQGGMVSDGGNVGSIAGPSGAAGAMPTGEGQPFQFFRKADPARSVKLNVQGQTHEFELPTSEEQAQQAIRQATAASDLENTGKLNLLRGQNELNQVDLPGYGNVPKAAIPYYTSAEDNKAKAAAAELKPDKPADLLRKKQQDWIDNTTPVQRAAHVDEMIDPVKYPDINKTAKTQLEGAIQMGLPTSAIQAIVKDAGDKAIGRQTSIETAKNTLPFKIQFDQAKTAAKANSQAPGDTNLSGQDYLDTLPKGFAGTVKALAEGRQTLTHLGFREKQPYIDAVNVYDPGFTEQRAQIRKSFTTDKNIGALNTAAVHMDALGEIAKDMDNGSFQPFNAVWNRASTMLGGSAPTNYEGLRQAVAGEMDAALHGTSTIPGREAIAATMPAKASKGQMSGIVGTNLNTLAQKLNTYKERYEQQIPGDTVYSPVLPTAQAVFDKHGINPKTGGAGAASTKTAVGPNGHQLKVSADGKNWVDSQTGQVVQ